MRHATYKPDTEKKKKKKPVRGTQQTPPKMIRTDESQIKEFSKVAGYKINTQNRLCSSILINYQREIQGGKSHNYIKKT